MKDLALAHGRSARRRPRKAIALRELQDLGHVDDRNAFLDEASHDGVLGEPHSWSRAVQAWFERELARFPADGGRSPAHVDVSADGARTRALAVDLHALLDARGEVLWIDELEPMLGDLLMEDPAPAPGHAESPVLDATHRRRHR